MAPQLSQSSPRRLFYGTAKISNSLCHLTLSVTITLELREPSLLIVASVSRIRKPLAIDRCKRQPRSYVAKKVQGPRNAARKVEQARRVDSSLGRRPSNRSVSRERHAAPGERALIRVTVLKRTS